MTSRATLEDAVRLLRDSRPDEELLEGPGPASCFRAFSFDPFDEVPDPGPPSILCESKRTPGFERLTKAPQALVESAITENSCGTWNANGEGRWLASPKEWVIVDVDLVRQDDLADATSEEEADAKTVKVIFAAWKLKSGYALAIWRREEKALLAKMMGLKSWPKVGWKSCLVWYGG